MGAPKDRGGVRAAILAKISKEVVTAAHGLEVLMANNTTIQLRYVELGKTPRYFTITVRENIT